MASMNDRTKAVLAAGIASGYLMGRTRKAKLAFALATYVVGRRFRLHPMGVAEEGIHKLKDSPQLSKLGGQLGGQLLQAGRTAATTVVNHRLSSLADGLQSRTAALGGDGQRADEEEPDEGGPDEEQDEDQDEDQDEEQDEEQDEDQGEDRAERRSARSAARSRKAASAGKPEKSGRSEKSGKSGKPVGRSDAARKKAGRSSGSRSAERR